MNRLLQRYKDGDRMNHWFIALMFVLAALSADKIGMWFSR